MTRMPETYLDAASTTPLHPRARVQPVREAADARPVLLGDERERRRRAGMETHAGVAAMGAITHGSVRVSFLRDATGAEVDRLLEVLPAAAAELREMADLDSRTLDRVSTEGSGEARGVSR